MTNFSHRAAIDIDAAVGFGGSRPLPTKKSNPCPVCSDTDGKCRTFAHEPIVLCGNEHSGEVGGYRFVKPSRHPMWSVFAPIDGESGGDDWRQRLEDRERANRLKVVAPVQRKPVADRDKEYRSEFATLRQSRRENLKARGLTDSEIDWAISKHYLWDKGAGFAIAALSIDGMIQGCQVARDDRSPKYIWDSKDGSGQLPESNEMPIAYFMNPACDLSKPTKLIACDAFLKGLVAGIKHWRTGDYQTVFIGAPSCNFQPIQLQNLLRTLKPVSVTYAPDAGDVENPGMVKAIATFAERCTAVGYKPDVLWWGQISKPGQDLDDLSRDEYELAQHLTVAEFSKLASKIERRNRLIAERRQKFLQLLPTVSNDYQLTAGPGRVIECYEGFTPTFDIESERTILIRGWLAAGKTEAIIQSLRGFRNRQIIWLAPRNGLLRGTAERIAKAIGLPCYHYQDDAGLHRQMLLAGEPGIYMMAPDSLKSYSTGHDAGKVFDWSRSIVIADEFSGIRKEILGKSQSLPEFERAMREAGTFIAADAFLSNADCKIIGRYREGDRRILSQLPRKSPKKIQCIQTRTKDGLISMTHQGIALALIDQWVAEGIRSIAIATDNLLEGKIAQKYLESKGIKTLLICSETPEENHEYLPQPDECLRSRGQSMIGAGFCLNTLIAA